MQDLEQYFRHMARKSVEFEITLSELVKVGSPALKALTCLEANEATSGKNVPGHSSPVRYID